MLSRRTTFAFLLAILIVAPAGAQVIGKAMSAGNLPLCNSAVNYGVVYDATNGTTLGSGGGTAWVHVSCATGSWAIEEVAAVADLGAYLPVSGTTASPVSIGVSGAGNDLTGSATDDVIFLPGDDFRVTPTAGSFFLNAVGAGEDGSLVVVDDLIATGTDLLPTFSATAVITAPVTNIVAATSSTVTTATLTAAVTTAVVDAGGGADELTIAAASTTVIGAFKLTGAAAPPVACAAGTAGTIYYDSDINKACICNATNYVLMNDDATTTGCS